MSADVKKREKQILQKSPSIQIVNGKTEKFAIHRMLGFCHIFDTCKYDQVATKLGDLRLNGCIIRKSRFIFTKERRTIRQKSGCLNH